jgi:response regulator RpfG family c-di-GMP phosphodiesterase
MSPDRMVASNPRILVVDDEPAIRKYICESLERHSPCTCIGIENPRHAVDAAREHQIDVALLDLAMPEEDGISLARRLREQIRDLAVVMITGSQSFDAAVEAMRIGVLDYLLKPFEMGELFDTVHRAIEWRQAAVRAAGEREALQGQIAERAGRLRDTFSENAVGSSAALSALLETLNQRDPAALVHARRVAGFAIGVAELMGLDAALIAAVERAALLHDLGKIAIPDAIMYKPGPLTDDEFTIMRTHVQIGYDIVVNVPFLRPAAEIVLATHERFDGSGYPRGLKGSAIPIGARIITVVDVFDALTSARVYRDPICVDAANAELVRAAGSQFDPDVVAAWLKAVDWVLALTEGGAWSPTVQ